MFSETGFRHPAALERLDPVVTRYEDVTHVAVSGRSIRIGSRSSVYILNRSAFRRPEEAEAFVGELARRVAAAPGGEARVAAMHEIDRRSALAGKQWATWGLVALCAFVQILQLWDPGRWEAAGEFSTAWVSAGEYWRIVTANLLHAVPFVPVHFVLNALGLLALGALLEWTIGTARTALILFTSGIGAMSAGWLVQYEQAVGASGIVMGVFGALVFLELRHGGELPAHWRLPRAVIWAGIALQAALEIVAWAFFPIIATGAHVGGFVSGFATCAVVGRAGLYREPVSGRLRAANAVAAAVVLLAVVNVGQTYARGPDLIRQADLLLERERVPPQALNNLAWLMATGEDPSGEELDAALSLAERAVDETARRQPNILDTLAEVLFQLGQTEEAIAVIEEAMQLDPTEGYYRGQRDRFLGRREDRPDPPSLPQGPPRSGPLDPTAPEFPI